MKSISIFEFGKQLSHKVRLVKNLVTILETIFLIAFSPNLIGMFVIMIIFFNPNQELAQI